MKFWDQLYSKILVGGRIRVTIETNGTAWRVIYTTPDAGRYITQTRHPNLERARAEYDSL